MKEKEYIIFCDESEKRGIHYSNFYGGIIVGGSQYKQITERLNKKKAKLNLFGEVKWEKVTQRYLEKYQSLMKALFDEIRSGKLKIRIMFRQNAHEPKGLTPDHQELEYFLLYYQFIKHGFGLQYMNTHNESTSLRLYFDRLPDTKERCAQFKGYIHGLQEIMPKNAGKIKIREGDIVEVRSHDHVLLQCTDIVLGSMAFRLNNRHEAKRPETGRRGKRTIAKEKLYKAILGEINTLRPNFNIGVTTGSDNDPATAWSHPYRHWSFRPKQCAYNRRRTKRAQKKNPA